MNLFGKSFYQKLEEKAIETDFIYSKEQEKYNEIIIEKKEIILNLLINIRKQIVDPKYRNIKRAYKSNCSYNNSILGGNTPADYPIGHCGQITKEVYKEFINTKIYKELNDQGIFIKKIFVILQDKIFQNAIQIGNFYVNIANEKPKDTHFEHFSTGIIKNFNDFKEYIKIVKIYWESNILLNPIPKLSFVAPLLLFMKGQLFIYRNLPKRLLLNLFKTDFKEIEEIFFQEIAKRKIDDRLISLLNFELKIGKIKNVEIIKDYNLFIIEWEKLKKEREGYGKEKYDERLFETYIPNKLN